MGCRGLTRHDDTRRPRQALWTTTCTFCCMRCAVLLPGQPGRQFLPKSSARLAHSLHMYSSNMGVASDVASTAETLADCLSPSPAGKPSQRVSHRAASLVWKCHVFHSVPLSEGGKNKMEWQPIIVDLVQEPIPETSTTSCMDAPAVRWGAAAEQGQRNHMEDTHLGVLDVEAHLGRSFGTPARSAFFGVSALAGCA